jgi:hypothetical protein
MGLAWNVNEWIYHTFFFWVFVLKNKNIWKKERHVKIQRDERRERDRKRERQKEREVDKKKEWERQKREKIHI